MLYIVVWENIPMFWADPWQIGDDINIANLVHCVWDTWSLHQFPWSPYIYTLDSSSHIEGSLHWQNLPSTYFRVDLRIIEGRENNFERKSLILFYSNKQWLQKCFDDVSSNWLLRTLPNRFTWSSFGLACIALDTIARVWTSETLYITSF